MAGIVPSTLAFVNAALTMGFPPNTSSDAVFGMLENASAHQYTHRVVGFHLSAKTANPLEPPPHAKPFISTKTAPFEVLSSRNGHCIVGSEVHHP